MFNTFFYQPLYNALVFLAGIVPGHSLGLAIIILTIIVRIILFPLYQKAAVTQFKMRKIEPELKKIKEKYTDRQEQTEKTLKLYKDNQVNPFASIIALFIQIPLIIALFMVFKSNIAGVIDPKMLYSFVSVPSSPVSVIFLGILDLTAKSIVMALLVGLSQFIQMQITLPKSEPKIPGSKSSLQEDLSRSMNMQMKYVMPLFIAFISASFSSAISLYWLTGNLFSIGQEIYVKKKLRK